MQIRLAALTVVCAAAFAQTPEQTRTFSFAHVQTPQQMQEVVNMVRSLVELRNVTADPAQRTLTVGGNAERLAFTSWLLTDLDKPAGLSAALTIRENSFPDPSASAVRIYYVSKVSSPQSLQEVVNSIRSIAEIQRVMVITATSAILVRGTPEQVALADWMVREFDAPAAGSGAVHKQVFADLLSPSHRATAVRIYYPATISTPLELQETINGVRSIAEVQRAVGFTAGRAIILRCSDEQAALTDWLMKELDQNLPSPGAHETQFAEGKVRTVVLPKGTDLMGAVRRVREASGMQRVVAIQKNRTVVLRGTAEQLASAEPLLR